MFGEPSAIGQRYYPLGSKKHSCLKNGWHSIKLKNPYGLGAGLTTLLVHVEVTFRKLNLKNLAAKADLNRAFKERDALAQEVMVLKRNGQDSQEVERKLEL